MRSGESPPTMRRHRVSRQAPGKTPPEVHSGATPEPSLSVLTHGRRAPASHRQGLRIQESRFFFTFMQSSSFHRISCKPWSLPLRRALHSCKNFLFDFKEQWPPRLGTWELAGALPGHDKEMGPPPGGLQATPTTHPVPVLLTEWTTFSRTFSTVGQKADEWLQGSASSSERGR